MDDVCGAMIQMNMDGTIISMNNSASIMLGYSEEEMLGKNGM